jgi:hypothetical protein
MRLKNLILGAVLLLLSSGTAGATNNTPGPHNTAIRWEPFAYRFGESSTAFLKTATDQGWVVNNYVQSTAPTSGFPPFGLNSWATAVSAGPGLICMFTHGSTAGFVVETYAGTSDGLDLRDVMYTVYTDPSGGGWTDMRDIYPITSLLNGSYCIGITPTGNASVFVSNNTLVYNVSCQGHTYHATAWPEARVCLGYSNVCNSDNAKNDTDIFWNQMNKGVYRDVGHARTLLNIECDGNKATTVGLMVDYARDLATGSQLFNAYQVPEGGLNVRIRFDTQVTQSDQPILTTGRLNSTGAVWENDSTLQVHVGVNGIGYGDLQILASKITSYTNNSIHLDGNGAGPSGDNFTVRLCNNDCPAAAVGGFTVSGTTASWYVDTEDNTASYSIEGSNDTNGPWSSLTTVGAGVGPRSYIR